VAAPSGQLKASRYFAALALIVAVIYALVFFTGDKKPHPKLGLDLQGGTSMTLAATLTGNKAPDAATLEVARARIADRVNNTGVTESEVIIQGDRNIVVDVPGVNRGDELRKLVAPAQLRFRLVLNTTTDTATDPSPSASASTSASPGASAAAGASASASPSVSTSASAAASASAPASASTSASGSAAPVDAVTEQTRAAVIAKLGAELYNGASSMPDPDPKQPVDPAMLAALAPFGTLTSDEVAVLPPELQFKVPTISCKQLDRRPAGSIKNPAEKVVACGKEQGGKTKYLLDVSKVLGEDVKSADYGNDPTQGGWKVDLTFTGDGQDKWTKLTTEAYDNGAKKSVAVVLDNTVVSAPQIQEVIPGNAQITGSFSKDDVETLASQLKFGSLPLSFTEESTDDVTATIGLQQMRAGVLAGGIGLALVVVYCMFYYRALGIVVIASLIASGLVLFGLLVILGREMGFALSLAGIAGFIVAIGITADSFVVFFERLKDEVKEGRTVRSAVPRAWARARRTILSADTVSFLAAAVLFVLAVGQVKGFAFTLGMSTIVDLLIVFLFTHPLVAVLARSNGFTSPRVSGLGNARSDKAIAQSAPRLGAVRTKES
jgi:preprotein translocase subunit SecD